MQFQSLVGTALGNLALALEVPHCMSPHSQDKTSWKFFVPSKEPIEFSFTNGEDMTNNV